MLAVYRHDIHKFTGKSHKDAREEFAGIPVNQSVPEGADGDAAALSRPLDVQKQTVPTYADQYRLSLLTGDPACDPVGVTRTGLARNVVELIDTDDAENAHKRWLASNVAAGFNESIYHPYTSLKYHTLLVAALLDNYCADSEFADLRLIVDPAGKVIASRTIFDGEEFALRIDSDDGGRPSARLGSRPWRSWSSTWNRLTAHPLDTDRGKYDMTLDANLRRIWSWSTALQYIEDYDAWRPDR